jgi:hypothetical protein
MAVRAIRLLAVAVDGEGVFGDLEAAFQGDLMLAAFDFLVVELFDVAAVKTDEVIVV